MTTSTTLADSDLDRMIATALSHAQVFAPPLPSASNDNRYITRLMMACCLALFITTGFLSYLGGTIIDLGTDSEFAESNVETGDLDEVALLSNSVFIGF